MVLILIFTITFSLAENLPEPCCSRKTVGDVSYTLVNSEDTSATSSYGCKSNCVYQQDDLPDSLFCFADGDLSTTCTGLAANGPDPNRPDISQVATSVNSPVSNILEELEKLVEAPYKASPNSKQFPTISGPSENEKVCVVGAGPSGIHMALKLKNFGYSDVTVLEKSGRVGGKSFDVLYHGVEYSLGTSFLQPNYFRSVVPLAKEYADATLHDIPTIGMWEENSATPRQISFSQYIYEGLAKFNNTACPILPPDPETCALFFGDVVLKYIKLHQELFGVYKGDFMQEPDQAILERVSGTFKLFLEKEGLLAMEPILKVSNELQGYGYLDEVSALYGLIWNTPKFMYSYVLRAFKKKKEEPYGSYIFKYGFQQIWTNIVERESIDVKFYQDITSVERNEIDVQIKVWNSSISSFEEINCGFLIWTAPMEAFLKVADASLEERQLLQSLTPRYFTASLVNMKESIKTALFNVYLKNLNSESGYGGSLHANVNYKRALDPTTTSPIESFSILQQSQNELPKEKLNEILKEFYESGFKATSVEVLRTINWEYFYRWTPEEMAEGRIWEVFQMQGQRRTWYAGSSVGFESVLNVVSYNNLLLQQSSICHDSCLKQCVYECKIIVTGGEECEKRCPSECQEKCSP